MMSVSMHVCSDVCESKSEKEREDIHIYILRERERERERERKRKIYWQGELVEMYKKYKKIKEN